MLNPLVGCDILVVEDEFLISEYIRQLLEDAGARVTSAARISEGLAALDQAYAAAVLDVRLPDGEVFPVADLLCEREVPIVFHSGHAKADVLTSQYPQAIYLEKPVNEGELLGSIIIAAKNGKRGIT